MSSLKAIILIMAMQGLHCSLVVEDIFVPSECSFHVAPSDHVLMYTLKFPSAFH